MIQLIIKTACPPPYHIAAATTVHIAPPNTTIGEVFHRSAILWRHMQGRLTHGTANFARLALCDSTHQEL